MPHGLPATQSSRCTESGRQPEADGDVLGTIIVGRAVAHPLARVRDDRLARAYGERAGPALDPQQTAQDDGDLLELGLLAVPASRRATPSAPRSAFRGRSSRGR